jgi:hypothetical protein
MNVKKDDYRGLLNEITIASDKNFSEPQAVSLIDSMKTLGWNGSYRITVMVTRTGNLPKNIYGHVLSLIEDDIDRARKQFIQKEEWAVKEEDCATPEEFKLTMKCIGLICRFENSVELCKLFGDYLLGAYKKGILLESLKKADVFYSEQLKKDENIKKFCNELI